MSMSDQAVQYVGLALMAVAVLWFLWRTGFGALILLFIVTGILTVAFEGLVYIGLWMVVPGAMETGFGSRLVQWWWAPPVVVALLISFKSWGEV